MRILIIEDDLKLRRYVREYLEAYEYEVFFINNFLGVKDEIKNYKPDLILLDINLPVFDGFYFLKVIRNEFDIPVIIVSARDSEAEQIRGIELGADDYITKPFSIGILVAKINAVLRRASSVQKSVSEKVVSINNLELTLNDELMKISYGDEIIELSKNEYRILNTLVKKEAMIVTREEILEELWDNVSFVDDNTLNVNIARLKKKLEGVGIKDIIKAKRGVGYVFNQ